MSRTMGMVRELLDLLNEDFVRLHEERAKRREVEELSRLRRMNVKERLKDPVCREKLIQQTVAALRSLSAEVGHTVVQEAFSKIRQEERQRRDEQDELGAPFDL